MDLDGYYTALPDDKSELSIYVKNGFFSYGSTVEESQESQTNAQDEENQDAETSTKFVLRNITITVKEVSKFEVCFLSWEVIFVLCLACIWEVLGLGPLHKGLFTHHCSFKYKNQYYRVFHNMFTVAMYLILKLCSNKETMQVGS